MKQGTRLLASVACGVGAMLVSLSFASSVRADAERVQAEALARYGSDLVAVCVAARDIEPGETLDETNVRLEQWVASLLPEDAETSLSRVEGALATSRVPKNAVICPVYLKEAKGAVEVPAGTVAVSVAVDAEHAVGGAVRAGDFVDVYVSRSGISDRLCSARVIDTSASAQPSGEGKISWATLAVDPVSVSELLAATVQGTVSLVLPGDSASLDERIAEPEAPADAPPEAADEGEAVAEPGEDGGER